MEEYEENHQQFSDKFCIYAKNKHQQAFEIVSIDTVGSFTKTINGNRYAVTIQCALTKYLIATPIREKEPNTIARAIVDLFILIYEAMQKITTDLGTEY